MSSRDKQLRFAESKFEALLERRKQFCVLGIDDTPFQRRQTEPVSIAGVLCHNTRFEGMIWSELDCDGDNATAVLIDKIQKSKFYPQLHLILLDGIALGGFNVVDLPRLSQALGLPCVALMRRYPDIEGIQKALKKAGFFEQKWPLFERAGEIHYSAPFYFQVMGMSPELIARVLPVLTDRGHVPEALRLAHLIGAAVKLGESSRRA